MFLCDGAIILSSAQIAWNLRFGMSLMASDYIFVITIGCLTWLLTANKSNLYKTQEHCHAWQGIRKVIMNWVYVVLGVSVLAFATKSGQEFSRLWAAGWFACSLVGLSLVRIAWNIATQRAEQAGILTTKIALVGTDEKQVKKVSCFLEESDQPIDIVSVFIESLNTNQCSTKRETNGGITNLINNYHTLDLDGVWLAVDWNEPKKIEFLRNQLAVLPCEIHAPILPIARSFPRYKVNQQIGIPALTLGRRPLADNEIFLKRAEDLFFGALAIIALSPLMLLVALLIKLDSSGPVFFRQIRHGFANGTFEVFKFRTMTLESCSDNKFSQATKNDPRVTRIGKVLRRTSIDEVPQLLNVILGHMSLVGPRPHPVALSNRYLGNIDEYLARHRMKPGITGWAQIHGFRGETDTEEKMMNRIEYDLWYVDNWSIWLDIRILFMTLPALLDKNAY